MKPSLRFLYLHCTDLNKMREFYTDLILLPEIYYAYTSDEKVVAYKCDALQLSIHESQANFAPIHDWSIQPGWTGGENYRISWSIECQKEDYYLIVSNVKNSGVCCFYTDPKWKGYWSFPVKDPMGNTVELTFPEAS